MIIKNLSQANTDLILGYIKKSLNQSEIIDDINLQTTSCFSSVKIDNLLEELTTKLKDYSDNLFNSLTALTVQIATEQPTLENSEKNIIYLYLTDAVNHVYMQYLKISDTELITLGETTIDLTDYYTKTQIDNSFATKTQVKTLEDDSHKHLNKDILDKLSVNDEDKLLYNGNKIGNDVVATKDTLGIVRIGNGLKVDSGIVSFDGSNYYTKTQTNDNFATIKTVEELKKKIVNSGSASSLKEYDNTTTYLSGDICIYDGSIYQCIQDITVAENFNTSKWKKVISGDINIDKVVMKSNIIMGLNEW